METNPLLEQLKQPDIQAALVSLLSQLPTYEKTYKPSGMSSVLDKRYCKISNPFKNMMNLYEAIT